MTEIHRGVEITRREVTFPATHLALARTGIGWITTDLYGTERVYKTRKEARQWIDRWMEEVGRVRLPISGGTYWRFTVKDGKFAQEEATREEWLAQREETK